MWAHLRACEVCVYTTCNSGCVQRKNTMDQTGLTFVLSEDGLQSLTFCLDQATGLYYVPGEAPLALDEFGSVERCFMPAAGGFESFVLKKVLLSAGGTLQEEYLRLCAVINIPGTVTVVQPPVFSATHGYLLTEYVVMYRRTTV